MKSSDILFKDSHFIIVSKDSGIPVQPDKSGDLSLQESLELQFHKKLYLITRLDRPVSGIVLFAKTKKAVSVFGKKSFKYLLQKKYIAAVANKPPENKGKLSNYLFKKNSKSYISDKPDKGKEASLAYRMIAQSDNYFFLEIEMASGRFHQIRSQLAHVNCPIKGDVKYGARRSNKDRSIHLHARSIQFHNPFGQNEIKVIAPFPEDSLWSFFEKLSI